MNTYIIFLLYFVFAILFGIVALALTRKFIEEDLSDSIFLLSVMWPAAILAGISASPIILITLLVTHIKDSKTNKRNQ